MKRLGICLAVGLLAVSGSEAQQKGPVLPDAVYLALLPESVKVAQAALAGEPSLRSAGRARVALVMLAEFAQQNLGGADGAVRASVRDAALATALRVKNKEYAAARKQLAMLARLAASPQAKKEKLPLLGRHLELDELMSQFRPTKTGGLGIEEQLDRLAGAAGERIPDAALNEKLRQVAYQTGIAGQLAREHLPDKMVKEWKGLAEQMEQSALALARAVEQKDGKSAFAALGPLQTSCHQCHKIFR